MTKLDGYWLCDCWKCHEYVCGERVIGFRVETRKCLFLGGHSLVQLRDE